MDRFLYVSMSGAKETMRAQTANNHNLANASTTGFRADLSAFQTRAVTGSGFASRAYATNATTGWDQNTGSALSTGRALDVALQGPGWIAVQTREGGEGYTRAGDLRVDANGMLMNGAGHPVMSEAGPMTVPEFQSISIAVDGTVSIVPLGQTANTVADIGRIKLVNPDPKSIERGEDGIFRSRDNAVAEADVNVRVTSGALESSNVNTAAAMVNMIELSRHFEMQVKAMRTAEDNAAASAQLLRMG